MNTIYLAITVGLITSCCITISGVVIYSSKKPHGVSYTWDEFERKILPALTSKVQQMEESVNALEPQA